MKIEIREETANVLLQMLLDLPLKTSAVAYNMLQTDIENSKSNSENKTEDKN